MSSYSEVPLCTCTYSIRRVLLKLVNRCDYVEFYDLVFLGWLLLSVLERSS